MVLLFVIEDVFAIEGRGVIVAGRLADSNSFRCSIGDQVEIHRQNGSVVRSHISGMPMGMLPAGKADILLRGLDGSDVAVGDAVWIHPASDALSNPENI